MSLSLKFVSLINFVSKRSIFQREDKDQDALLTKEALSNASEK
jgi:hypothetical protein